MKKDLLFDLDGTIVDINGTRERVLWEIVGSSMLEKNYSFDRLSSDIKTGQKRDLFHIVENIMSRNSVNIDIGYIRNRFTTEYTAPARNYERLLVGKKTLEDLRQKYDMYIITGRPREFYDPVWGQRLEGYFKGVVCHGDFENTPRKPEPDIILKAIEKFGLDPEYYIGNEENDILAAHGAGLKSIIVAPLDGDRDRFLASDVIIKSIDDLKDLLIL